MSNPVGDCLIPRQPSEENLRCSEAYDVGYKMGFQACKQKVIEIITKNTPHDFTLGDIMKMIEEVNKL